MKNRKTRATLIPLSLIFLLLISSPASATSQYDVNDFTFHFVLGDFQLVGRKPGSGTPYTGTATISQSGKFLRIQRCIDGKVITGSGTVKTITADEVPIVSYIYKVDDVTFEGHYEVSGDINNYARLGGPYVDVKLQGLVGWEFLYVDARNISPCK